MKFTEFPVDPPTDPGGLDFEAILGPFGYPNSQGDVFQGPQMEHRTEYLRGMEYGVHCTGAAGK